MRVSSRQEKLERTDWRAYVILDPRFLHKERDLLETAQLALRGGAGVLQLRDKESDAQTLVERAQALQDLCDGYDALFIVNDRVDVALAAGCDGVHLGPHDIPVERARAIAPDLVIGSSAGTAEVAKFLQGQGADYLGVGAIYDAHPSKPDASAPRGPQAVALVTSQVEIPVVGIGGITADNAAAVSAHGAAGVAVIRQVVASDDPEAATRALRQAVDRGLKSR
ncbi:thiamine phosphate synthase [Persicimonas caeni]|uniref:Thiamine-phosphate synthase n=1 Tax=Persicimonas caeni TaxID=2292766 RepID=A0A4Y6PP00_PERCE|nr:thiamine phosphate synthase [Persicimonas caeni]QDG50056.1 thiamine phosphate synthase [Persicimonas caeni]QED31277.1 thiamine phosphate synthase [Persicimonas caeni]